MQLSGEEVFVIRNRSSGEALAQLRDFFCAGAAPANFRTTAGCGHKVLLMVFSAGIQQLVFSELTVKSRVRVTAGAVDSRRRLNYRVHRHRWQSGSGRNYTP